MRLPSILLAFSPFDFVLQPAGPPAQQRRPQHTSSHGGRSSSTDVAHVNAELRRFVSLRQGK